MGRVAAFLGQSGQYRVWNLGLDEVGHPIEARAAAGTGTALVAHGVLGVRPGADDPPDLALPDPGTDADIHD